MGWEEIRRKRKQSLLLISQDSLSSNEEVKTIVEIRNKLRVVFKEHIGIENGITPVELFEKVYEVQAHSIDTFRRAYWWNIIKDCIRAMRKEGNTFIINKGSTLFVLKTKAEAQGYKNILNNKIREMRRSKKRADEWVKKEKWKEI